MANAALVVFLLLSLVCGRCEVVKGDQGFVQSQGSRFVVNGRSLYVNGFNAYYLTVLSVDAGYRPTVRQLLREAASAGLNVGRTWAFNDGGYRALQTAPGTLDETVFQALDFVISEAKSSGIRLILSLVNNYPAMGGKAQYVEWARQAGVSLPSEDAFFYDPTVKGYLKNYIHRVLTRVNSITGVAYKDEPAIFAWELMNEPRCMGDSSGDTLQGWIEEMAAHVKSIDKNHMLEIGLEGFYGSSTPSLVQAANPPGFSTHEGTDFQRNNLISTVDFASVHSYPDQWIPNAGFEERQAFLRQWINSHLEAGKALGKPILFSEFGFSKEDPAYSASNRDAFFSAMYDMVFSSASTGGAGAGCLLWQLFPGSSSSVASSFGDGYAIVLSQDSSIARAIAAQSRKLSALSIPA